eukprot:CAMPEP_0184366912 /NCGR_PEP_ID=MMETSP1089-20130417/156054_1 /TAXON_ID=38269 ORGANISM="Gloeochaete wittrockiana, Strain SAG46.84" /NCGR_SAMPLE_ID=MMETSP1089 /ASSEMBLY_ACC=CAM_ASM_000445 /LENGTH=54 /DNA_ID=CAMNT_0026708709 /DNA_START=87 /DNA_END=248 /DNA_ORIENTATION=+
MSFFIPCALRRVVTNGLYQTVQSIVPSLVAKPELVPLGHTQLDLTRKCATPAWL